MSRESRTCKMKRKPLATSTALAKKTKQEEMDEITNPEESVAIKEKIFKRAEKQIHES